MTALIGRSSALFVQREPSEHIGIDKKEQVRVSLTRMMLLCRQRCRVRPPALPCRLAVVLLLPQTTFMPRATDRTDLIPLSIFSRNNATNGAGRYIGRAREMWRSAPAAIAAIVAESPSAAVVYRGEAHSFSPTKARPSLDSDASECAEQCRCPHHRHWHRNRHPRAASATSPNDK